MQKRGVNLITYELTPLQAALKELILMVENSLKFLNSLLEFGYYQSVLFFRFSKQIGRAIIVFNPIKVMNFPAFRKRFAVGLLPNKDMFQHSITFCSWMTRAVNPDITMSIHTTPTTPIVVLLPTRTYIAFFHAAYANSPSPFLLATSAQFSLVAYLRSALGAVIYWIFVPNGFPCFFHCATSASGSITRSRLPTVSTYSHSISILPYGYDICKKK